MPGLERVRKSIPFGTGLVTNWDKRASSPPSLDVLRDGQFEELQGIQTRFPFANLPGNGAIFGGGTLSNCRVFYKNGDELICFTDTALYSYNAQLQKWVLRATHYAIATTETPTFVTTGDQIDADRAELNGTVVFVWAESTTVYAAAFDKTTRAVLVAPTVVSSAQLRPRLVALNTKILFFVDDGAGNLTARSIDPASPATAIGGAGTNVIAGALNFFYDVDKAGTQDLAVGVCRRLVTTSYSYFTVTPVLSVSASIKARTADGPLAVCTTSDGTQSQVIRANGTNVQGDLLTTATAADVFTGQAIGTVVGTPINQVAAAFANATTCYAFWSTLETTGTGNASFQTKVNSVTTANVVGTQATLVFRVGVASRAFTYGGHVFVWLVFDEESSSFGTGKPVGVRAQLQNSYFLYREDGFLVAKAVFNNAGGYAPSQGSLPHVQALSSTQFAWAGTSRRVIDLGGDEHTGYAARSPVDVAITFDANSARRCVRFGKTLYVSGSLPLQYDGVSLYECGFLVYPWAFGTQDSGVAGNVDVGVHAYKSTLKWVNAQGEVERSTTATGEQVTLGVAHIVLLTVFYLQVTRKAAPRPPSVEIWRTLVNPTAEAPFYLVSGQDPNTVAGDNAYIPNATTTGSVAGSDNLSDANAAVREVNPENGGALESLAPPSCSIIYATDTRMFLAGIASQPDTVWYSKQRQDGEIASFNDALTIQVPPAGGNITAVAFLNEALIVFRQHAIYEFGGVGFDNVGGGQNYQLVAQLSSDVGAINAESVALTPMGLIFKSSKGWYLLTKGLQPEYIGGPVKDFDSDTVYAVHVIEDKHQVRCLTNNRMLVFDYFVNQWAEWTISDGLHAAIWNGAYHYLSTTGPKAEQPTFSGVTYGLDAETSWVKPAELQGNGRLRWLALLGEWRDTSLVRIRVAKDYQYDVSGNPVWYADKPYTINLHGTETPGDVLQLRYSPESGNSRCEAFKIRVTACSEGSRAALLTALMATPVQCLTGGNWNAGLAPNEPYVGEYGNGITLSVAFESISTGTFSITVHDNARYDLASAKWVSEMRTVGVLVQLRTGSAPTIGQLETAINTSSVLAVISADPSPTKVINAAAMIGHTASRVTASGSYAAPVGESPKLTGIDVELGVKPGIYKQLPASKKG